MAHKAQRARCALEAPHRALWGPLGPYKALYGPKRGLILIPVFLILGPIFPFWVGVGLHVARRMPSFGGGFRLRSAMPLGMRLLPELVLRLRKLRQHPFKWIEPDSRQQPTKGK